MGRKSDANENASSQNSVRRKTAIAAAWRRYDNTIQKDTQERIGDFEDRNRRVAGVTVIFTSRNHLSHMMDAMMTEKERQVIQSALGEITNSIVAQAQQTAEGIYWYTAKPVAEDEPRTSRPELYEGTGGILYFLIKAYEAGFYERGKLEPIIKGGLEWLRRQRPANSSLYAGSAGIAVLFLQWWRISGNKEALDETKRILFDIGTAGMSTRHELLLGNAGILLAMMFYYQHTSDGMIIPHISSLLRCMVAGTKFPGKGIYWDNSQYQNKGLCGISHGVCGPAYIMVLTGAALRMPDLVSLGKQGMLYENSEYKREIKSWPDHRHGIFTPAKDAGVFEKKFLQQDYQFFDRYQDMTAWCHGAIGIGLSRIMVLDVLEQAAWVRRDIRRCLRKIAEYVHKQTSPATHHTICHGKGGATLFYLQHFRRFKDRYSFLEAKRLVLEAVEQKERYGIYFSGQSDPRNADLSLFNGIAGIGYIMAEILAPSDFNIFIPGLPPCSLATPVTPPHLHFNVKADMLYGHFPDLLGHFSKDDIADIMAEIDLDTALLRNNVMQVVKQHLGRLPHNLQKSTLLHLQIFKRKESISKCYLDVLHTMGNRSAQADIIVKDEMVLQTPYGIEQIRIAGQWFILKHGLDNIKSIPTNAVIGDILKFFGQKKTFGELVMFSQGTTWGRNTDIDKLTGFLKAQLTEFIKNGLLLKVSGFYEN